MKEKKEALAVKRSLRGSVEDPSEGNFASEDNTEITKPSLFKAGAPSFKSRLHSELRERDKEVKAKFARDIEDRKQKAERLRSYSKNVKEMYMPYSNRNKVMNSLPDLP